MGIAAARGTHFRAIRSVMVLAAFFAVPLGMTGAGLTAVACPFCDVVGRPLASRRDEAAVVAVAEASGLAAREQALVRQPFTVRTVLRGRGLAEHQTVVARVSGPTLGTALLLGDAGAEERFEAIAADETLLAYVVAAPPVEAAAVVRLAWFARWLEHPDPAIAADAFLEFGLADYEAVVAASNALDAVRLRTWLTEPGVEQRRRGFYGLALGILAARARDRGDLAEAADHAVALEQALTMPASDLRAGYDGLLGGLLVARGAAAIEWIRERGLLAADTRAGDARHVLAALRFGWEFLGESLPRAQVTAAAAELLANPAVAADTAVDLARWQAWERLADVAALWERLGRDDPLVRRAVAGYLTACPLEGARERGREIAAREPEAWAAALTAAGLPPRRAEESR